MVLPEPEPVGVTGGKVADVQTGAGERRDLSHLSLREEPIGDSALVEDLDGACVQAACARAGAVLTGAPLDDGDVDPRQRQLARQHQPRRAASGYHDRMLGHRPGEILQHDPVLEISRPKCHDEPVTTTAVEDALARGYESLVAGHWSDARAAFQEALDLNDSPEALDGLGRCAVVAAGRTRRGRPQRAGLCGVPARRRACARGAHRALALSGVPARIRQRRSIARLARAGRAPLARRGSWRRGGLARSHTL